MPRPDNAPNPYSAPEAELGEPQFGAQPHDQFASRLVRLLATAFDFGLMIGVWWVLGYATTGRFEPPTQDAILSLEGGLILTVLFSLLAINIYLLGVHQQTIGKRIFGIKLVRGDLRSRVSVKRIILLRFVPLWLLAASSTGILEQLGLWAYIPPIVAASVVDAIPIFGPKRRCLHDFIADTLVIRT